MNSLKDINVSVFKGYFNKTPIATISLYDALYNLADHTLVDEVRQTEDKERRKELKSHLLSFTPSGVFENLSLGAMPIKTSGNMCIDIDLDDNPGMDVEKVKQQLAKIRQVAYCGLSVSGKGLFMIIPISNPEKYAEHYYQFSHLLMNKFGLKTDPSCKNIGRLRVASYDNNAYFNPKAIIFTQIKEEEKAIEYPKHFTNSTAYIGHSTQNVSNDVDQYIHHLCTNHIDITDEYSTWFSIGCALANEFGEEGRKRFHYVSSISNKYKESECDRKYDDCLKCSTRITIASFFYHCHQAGVKL